MLLQQYAASQEFLNIAAKRDHLSIPESSAPRDTTTRRRQARRAGIWGRPSSLFLRPLSRALAALAWCLVGTPAITQIRHTTPTHLQVEIVRFRIAVPPDLDFSVGPGKLRLKKSNPRAECGVKPKGYLLPRHEFCTARAGRGFWSRAQHARGCRKVICCHGTGSVPRGQAGDPRVALSTLAAAGTVCMSAGRV
jgi:hypothetical protein